MLFWDYAFGIAVLITAIGTMLDIVLRTHHNKEGYIRVAAGAIASLLILTIVNWLILWFFMPRQTGTLWGYSWMIFPLIISGIIFWLAELQTRHDRWNQTYHSVGGWAGPTYVVGAIVLILFVSVDQCTVRSQDGATYLATRVEVIDQAASEYPDTDTDHIVQVPESNAVLKARQYIATENIGEDGRATNLSTVYKPGKAELQSVGEQLYWIFALDFTGWRSFNRVDNISPGYIVVDAEDPNAQPQLKLGFKMQEIPSSYHSSKLQRQLDKQGYRDYIIDDLTLEVDDDWNPYYTASLNKKTLHNGGEIPVKFLLYDPQTQEIEVTSLEEVPVWVDRVYSADRAKAMMSWWGDFGDSDSAPWKLFSKRSKIGRYKVVDDPVLVYTSSGHPA